MASIALILLLAGSALAWADPILLNHTTYNMTILSVYHDPVSSVSHVAVKNINLYIAYFAVAENGTILYKCKFETTSPEAAVIRGAGDGKRIFMSYEVYSGKHVAFSESVDGGAHWSTPIVVTQYLPENRYLEDMIYIKETGRVIIFFSTPSDLRMVSRAPGSVVFSAAGRVAQQMYLYFGHAVAGYSMFFARTYIHVVFRNGIGAGCPLMYTRSSDNGVTWSIPKAISDSWSARYLTRMIVSGRMGASIFIGYMGTKREGQSPASVGAARMVYSLNYGATFQAHVDVTLNSQGMNPAGLAQCENGKEVNMLLSFFPRTNDQPQIAMWDQSNVSPYYMKQPFNLLQIGSVGVGCTIDDANSVMKAFAFCTIWDGERAKLYYSFNAEPVPAAKSAQ